MAVLGSPRARRRAGWIGALVASPRPLRRPPSSRCPRARRSVRSLRPGAQVVRIARARQAHARRAGRRSTTLLDTFVPAAVERQEPLRRCRSSRSRSARASRARSGQRGDLPVFPYDAQGEQFHSWTLNYSFPREISVDLLLHPAPKETLGALAITAVFKQVARTLADRLVRPGRLVRAAEEEAAKVLASPDFTPFAETRGNAQLSTLAARAGRNPRADRARSDRVRHRAPAPLAPRLARVPGSLDCFRRGTEAFRTASGPGGSSAKDSSSGPAVNFSLAASRRAKQRHHVFGLGIAPEHRLLEDQFVVDVHVEDAADSGHQLDGADALLELFENLRRQTDGVRPRASGDAVLDADARALRSRLRGSVLTCLLEPGLDAVPRVDLVLALRPAVALARVHDELDLAAGLDERVVELRRLRQRRAEVVLAVEDQRRRLALRARGRPATTSGTGLLGRRARPAGTARRSGRCSSCSGSSSSR